jgi:hypothetical protein
MVEIQNNNATLPIKIGIATCIRKPVDFSLWLKHHRNLGVSKFYIRVEDTPELEDYLALQPDVVLEKGASDKNGNNYKTIQTRQVNFVNGCIQRAISKGEVDWIFNIDGDELLHSEHSSPFHFLKQLDTKYKTVKLRNVEAVYSGDEPHCFSCKKFKKCSEPGAKCRAYANGKGGGRIVTGVTQIGCHDFGFDGKHQGAFVYDVPFEDLHVLHYDSCSFGAWAEKFKHMSHNQQSSIPFDYYHESMDAIKNAWNIYVKNTHTSSSDNVDYYYIK